MKLGEGRPAVVNFAAADCLLDAIISFLSIGCHMNNVSSPSLVFYVKRKKGDCLSNRLSSMLCLWMAHHHSRPVHHSVLHHSWAIT